VALFTVLLEFAGGTYVSQAKGASPQDAIVSWAEGLRPSQIAGLGARRQIKLATTLRDAQPTRIVGAQNVWCTTALVDGRLALIHCVKTALEVNFEVQHR
jgi:hypothetical protein